MGSVKEHYDNLLAPLYAWISGGLEGKLEENEKFFESRGIRPMRSGVALDLGAGPGFQSIPLSQAGFKVVAIDLSHELLAELKSNAANLPIVTIEDDLLNFTTHISGSVELIVCMGDTITHLKSLEEVQTLIEDASRSLEDNGRMILGFRDLVPELKGLSRIIPVRSSPERIFTCFLEYEKNHVKVHDIVYEKNGNRWKMNASCFRKLRISAKGMAACLQRSDFTIETIDNNKGMITLIAQKNSGHRNSVSARSDHKV